MQVIIPPLSGFLDNVVHSNDHPAAIWIVQFMQVVIRSHSEDHEVHTDGNPASNWSMQFIQVVTLPQCG